MSDAGSLLVRAALIAALALLGYGAVQPYDGWARALSHLSAALLAAAAAMVYLGETSAYGPRGPGRLGEGAALAADSARRDRDGWRLARRAARVTTTGTAIYLVAILLAGPLRPSWGGVDWTFARWAVLPVVALQGLRAAILLSEAKDRFVLARIHRYEEGYGASEED